MLSEVLSFAVVLAVAAGAAVDSSSIHTPPFCHQLDCPTYTVTESNSDYELRHYEATTWVSVRKEGATRDVVNTQMFMTLFHYIDGNNANHAKIPMTAPVLMKVEHGQGPNCASNFTMHFMIPHTQWSSPIAPTDPSVSIVTTPAMDVYVKSFPGFASDTDYQTNLQALFKVLLAKNVQVDTTHYFDAGYDGPYQFAHRHNEIWLQAV